MNIEEIKTRLVLMDLEIGLHALAMRGRPGFATGVRPNHFIPGRDYTIMGELHFSDRDVLKPGDACEGWGAFYLPEQDIPQFVPGFAWHVTEAYTIVGYCRLRNIRIDLTEGEVVAEVRRRLDKLKTGQN